jgi:DNA-binding SARP family transcriptional activator/tetratricopeptide (TPR) repeat protein
VEFRILGPLEVVADGRELTPVRPKQRALLALLLLRANQVVSNDELLDALWGEAPPETASTALHGHVSALRKLLGSEAIQTKPHGYALRIRPEQLDLRRFEALTTAARKEHDAARRSDLLKSALSLFRGEPLSDFRYEGFAREEAARIEETRLGALEERIESDLELDRHLDLIPELERLVSANRLRERLRGQLMLALYRAGRQAEALHVYQEGRQELAEELGIDPGPVLQELERRILTQDPVLAPPVPAPAGRPMARRERKPVTILFCDLVGFTARSEELDPEDVQALLQPYFARVRGQLERFGGTVEKFIGDAVMGAFGAPTGHEDDPERAVRAALAIRDALSDELELRIAVHTGEALVTLDADPRAGEGIVAGDVVNTASRLQNAAPPNGVIVGEQTYRATGHAIAYHELEPVVARGKKEPLRVWEAVEVRREADARRPGAHLVGRQRELDQLIDTLRRAHAERAPQLLTIVGVPGIGKTRLVRELYTRVEAAPDDVTWLQGRSLPYGDGVTFWALGEIVKTQAGVFEGDSKNAVEEKLRLAVEGTLSEDKEREWVLRHLRPLVGLGSEGAVTGDRREEAFAAWGLLFEALAERSPLVLVVEDLHWADDGLLDFIDQLVDRATDVPLLLLATSRPELHERRPAWGGGKRNAATISLTPLSDVETERLLTELLELEVAPELLRRAQGNPLYAEEYARLVLERGLDHRSTQIPESLQALIAARLDALPLEEKALVQDAAVVGEVAWAGAVAAVGGRERAAVEELARPLEHKEFLRRRRRSSVEAETEYAFHHILVRDVAYGQIPRADRGLKHRRAAEWIESLGRREDHVELLAHHYAQALELARAIGGETGELEERARSTLRDAGDHAASLGALPSAVRFYGQALELWPEDDPERGVLLLRRAHARLFTEIDVEEELQAAAESLLAAGDRLRAAEATALLVTLYQEWGRGTLAREHLDRARDLIAGLPPSPEKAQALAEACRSRMMSGENEEAIRLGDEALAICDQLGLDEIRAAVLISMGPARAGVGDVERAIADQERGIAFARAINSHEAARGYGNLSSTVQAVGDLSGSYLVLREGLQLAERMGLRWYVRWLRIDELVELYYTGRDWNRLLEAVEEVAGEQAILRVVPYNLGIRIRLARGDLRGALAYVDQILHVVADSREPQILGAAWEVAAFAKLAAGEREACEELVERLIELPEWDSLWAYLHAPLFGIVLHALGRGDELAKLTAGATVRTPWLEASLASATGDFARAADIYEEMGDRPDEAYARLKSGEQLIGQERRAEAGAQLERALSFFRSVGATAYIIEAEALLAAFP